ncbi:MAG: peptidyl-prolyl cis-trans isomerase [Verrucomicrobiales bacterium]|nr:peptidyl-prolyl cis-trans isomerase [Verrucomicrobiales bacterium]
MNQLPEGIKDRVLEELVRFEAIYAKAKAEGYDRNPEILGELKRMMINKYRSAELKTKRAEVSISEAEIAQYYCANIARYSVPEERKAAIIFLGVPKTAPPEKKRDLFEKLATAGAIIGGSSSPESAFIEQTRRLSEHQASRYYGGEIGWLRADDKGGRAERCVVDALFSLREPAEISEVIQGAKGLYLVRLVERKAPYVRPLDELRNGIRQLLVRRMEEQQEKSFYASAKAGLKVEINRSAFASIEVPGRPAKDQPPSSPAFAHASPE